VASKGSFQIGWETWGRILLTASARGVLSRPRTRVGLGGRAYQETHRIDFVKFAEGGEEKLACPRNGEVAE